MAVKGVLTLMLVSLTVLAVVSGQVDSGRLKRSDDVAPLQTVVDNLSEQVTQLTAEMTAQRNAAQAQIATMQAQIDAVKINVAFHVHHSTDPFSVASHGTIVYDVVTTNVGNAYDHRTGFFAAPIPGTYVFFINCMAVDGTVDGADIVVEDTKVASCFSYKEHSFAYDQGATMATVHLQAGQRVSVRLNQNAQNVRGLWWNTFSGFLLQAEV